MINRILIRIKVVQQLYSYMLNRQEFKIQSAPVTTSRDKRFAYIAYRDLLMIMLELSGYTVNPRALSAVPDARLNKYLHGNIMMKSLSTDDSVKRLVAENGERIKIYRNILPDLFSAVTKSAMYRSFMHTKDRDLNTDARFWEVILATVMQESALLKNAMRDAEPELYSLTGFESAVDMAIKTIEDYRNSGSTYIEARNALTTSLKSAYTLYHSLLQLIVDITTAQSRRLDIARNKYLPTAEDLNPNMRLVDNRLSKYLAGAEELQEYVHDNPCSWENDDALTKALLDKILESQIYQDYLANPEDSFAVDADFWRQIMRTVILPSDELAEALEDKSIYWNDDLHVMGTFLLKTLKQFAANGPEETSLLPMYKDREDEEFGPGLFNAVINNRERYREMIDRFINSATWDSERLALMDVIIMMAAIAELLTYPAIPIAVTLNEYIEIANSYSTNRSGQFINGILYSIISSLQESGELVKK